MANNEDLRYQESASDFKNARRQADLEAIFARITGRKKELLPFEEVRNLLQGVESSQRGLREIPLDAIIGSVGRYSDFTRTFLPLYDRDIERWTRVKENIRRRGMNPIEVYQIGDAYFVLDGNHRVSIARSRGDQTIQAYITEIETRVQLSATDSPDDIILKSELVEFLQLTQLDQARPEARLEVTAPGNYRVLLQQIAQAWKQHVRQAEDLIPWNQAAEYWYDEEYLPAIDLIRKQGLIHAFPNRTETDLYVWITKRRKTLAKALGWEVPLSYTAEDLAGGGRSTRATGGWRRWALSTHKPGHLFTDYLVPISGTQQGWRGLEQAIVLGQLEKDTLRGLHVVRSEEERNSPRVENLRAEFQNRCREAGVKGELYIETGKISRVIYDFGRWTDLIVLNLENPPGNSPISRMTSGIRRIINQSVRPILFVPRVSSKIQNLLLAYDGSPKSREALYIASYLTGKWGMDLDILTVLEAGRTNQKTIDELREYLKMRRIFGNIIVKKGNVPEIILMTAREHQSDEIIMGGYSYSSMLGVVLGSTVDRVLQEAERPVLICR
jgi:nucleotide-binding universal stress UspA family protein